MTVRCTCDMSSGPSVQVLLAMGARCAKECEAFLALHDLTELLTSTGRLDIQPHRLLGATHRFLDMFVHAYGFEWLIPKAHWLLHMADALRRHGVLPNCFVLERKHRTGKRFADEMLNHHLERGHSKSLISEVTVSVFCNASVPRQPNLKLRFV